KGRAARAVQEFSWLHIPVVRAARLVGPTTSSGCRGPCSPTHPKAHGPPHACPGAHAAVCATPLGSTKNRSSLSVERLTGHTIDCALALLTGHQPPHPPAGLHAAVCTWWFASVVNTSSRLEDRLTAVTNPEAVTPAWICHHPCQPVCVGFHAALMMRPVSSATKMSI